MFELVMSTENAAFFEDDEEDGVQRWQPRDEVMRILNFVARQVDTWNGYDIWHTITDVNGNEIGRWRLKMEVTP